MFITLRTGIRLSMMRSLKMRFSSYNIRFDVCEVSVSSYYSM